MSITNDHLVVFEMVDLQTFNITVFECAPFFLVYPPELCVAMKEEPNHEVIKLSNDEVADQIAELNVNQNQASTAGFWSTSSSTDVYKFGLQPAEDILPFKKQTNVTQNDEGVAFHVDNHFNGLDKKVSSKIMAHCWWRIWDLEIGVEFCQGCSRYKVQGMKAFVRDNTWL
ncbi:hypothetical protein Hanom_Chr01g00017131 [Helianthus anomalus]